METSQGRRKNKNSMNSILCQFEIKLLFDLLKNCHGNITGEKEE
jgi:hypothetical protein